MTVAMSSRPVRRPGRKSPRSAVGTNFATAYPQALSAFEMPVSRSSEVNHLAVELELLLLDHLARRDDDLDVALLGGGVDDFGCGRVVEVDGPLAEQAGGEIGDGGRHRGWYPECRLPSVLSPCGSGSGPSHMISEALRRR